MNQQLMAYYNYWKDVQSIEDYEIFKNGIVEVEDIIIKQLCNLLSTKSLMNRFVQNRILDLGCGNGSIAKKMLQYLGIEDFLYTGIDINPLQIQNHLIHESSYCNLFTQDINAMNFQEKYDIVLSINSAYGIMNRKILEIIDLNLAPQGLFIILVNSTNGIFSQLSNIGRDFVRNDQDILIYLSNNNIEYEIFQLESDITYSEWDLSIFNYLLGQNSADKKTIKRIIHDFPTEIETAIIISP